MSLPNTCADCGTALPEDAPSGFCPNCLFRMAFAPSPTAAAGDDAVEPATPESRRLGDYELIEELGRGGMGVVWKARQVSLNRLVAVKLIKQGLDSSQVLSRFEAERQALALMDHPNIARVFEAGRTPEGWPFFVMELVQGVPITRFCDTEKLSIRERLELFVSVCQAIQHAHQKGIIHRDIKPGNVLVTRQDGKAVAKVIDFGIAKAVGPRLTEETLQTEMGAILGTLEYMSPEQARLDALDIDTRSDIYALGILLYELLTGTTPLNRKAIKQAAFDEVLRRIREEEPPRPSTRLLDRRDSLADTAAKRGLEPARLTRLIEGDVDWIVMKALEKDRNRRYETANGLALDILRHLHDEPVLAGPPTARYRVQKFVRKHRKAVGAAAGFVALLVAAAIVSVVLAIRADRERERAVKAEADTHTVLVFFQDHVISQVRSKGRNGGMGHDVSLRAALAAAEPILDRSFTNAPRVEASIRDVLGNAFIDLGQYTKAVHQHQRALDLWRRHRREQSADSQRELRIMNNLASSHQKLRQLDRAIPLFEEVLELRRTLLGPEDPATLVSMHNLATAYQDDGQTDRALKLHQETLRLRQTRLGPYHAYTLASMVGIGVAHRKARRYPEAKAAFEEALRLHQLHFPDDPDTVACMEHLAKVLQDTGQHAAALPLLRDVLERTRRQFPPEHPYVMYSCRNLADSFIATDQPAEAWPLFEEVLQARLARDGPLEIVTALNDLASALRKAGRLEQARDRAQESLQRGLAALSPASSATVRALDLFAATSVQTARLREALPTLEDFLRRSQGGPAATNRNVLNAAEFLLTACVNSGPADADLRDRATPMLEGIRLARQAVPGAERPRP